MLVTLTGSSAGQLVRSSSILVGQSSRACSGAVADLAHVYSRVQTATTVKACSGVVAAWPVHSRIQTTATVKACSGAVADLANVYSRVQTAATVKVEVASQNGLLACQHIDLYLGAGRPEGGIVQRLRALSTCSKTRFFDYFLSKKSEPLCLLFMTVFLCVRSSSPPQCTSCPKWALMRKPFPEVKSTVHMVDDQ